MSRSNPRLLGNCREVVVWGSPGHPSGMPWGGRAGLCVSGRGETKADTKLRTQPPPAFLGHEGVLVLQPPEWGVQEGTEGSCPPTALPRRALGW